MEATYRSYQRSGDPVGILAALTGACGAACSLILWFCQVRPADWLGSVAFEIAHGGAFRDGLLVMAAFLGTVALIASIPTALGTRGLRRGIPGSFVMALVALSYPVAAALHWVQVLQIPR
jgi:hypothetical protein